MSDKHGSGGQVSAGLSMRGAEIVVALFLLALGGLVVYDSIRLGAGWGSDGPEAGYFPFYIGALVCIGALVTLFQVFAGGDRYKGKIFVEWGPLKQVLQVLLPAVVYVLGIQLIGIYVASAVYIAVFMIWLGGYNWFKGLFTGVAVSVATFMMFEVWFKVPLFKGEFNPLSLIGY